MQDTDAARTAAGNAAADPGTARRARIAAERQDPAQERNVEILIPVKGEFASCAQYEKKPVFKLINAVSARHEGSFSALAKTEQQLLQYAQEKAYQVITEVYYSIVRMDAGNPENCIIDLYIGVNYNIL